MTAVRRPLLLSLVLIALLPLACGPTGELRLDPDALSLLRLEYLEHAQSLPPLTVDRVELPLGERLGSFSPVVWRVSAEGLPRSRTLRPLPYGDPAPRLADVLARTLTQFGFNTRGWTGTPPLRLRVEVQRLVLVTADGSVDTRSCDLDLRFVLEENPVGLEIRSYESRARVSFPGSWLAQREGFVAWAPRPGEPDPLDAAVARAAEDFLAQSLPFWKRPANWSEGRIELTRADAPRATAPVRRAAR